jgi:hypothetical protein
MGSFKGVSRLLYTIKKIRKGSHGILEKEREELINSKRWTS